MNKNHTDSLFEGQNLGPEQPQTKSADGEKANIELHGIPFPGVSVSGLTPVELFIVAKRVNNCMADLEDECLENPAIGRVDTVRLALLTAFKLGTDLYKMEQDEALTGKAIDRVAERLEQSLHKDPGK